MLYQTTFPRPVLYALLMLLITVWMQTATGSELTRTDTESDSYILGVFPHLPPRELEKVFAPMAADLGETVGRDIHFRSSTTYEKFSDNLNEGLYDIAFLQPFDYVRVSGKEGYLPLATRTQRLAAIIVTQTDSRLSDIDSLKGKRLSLPPESAAVSILIKDHLRRQGLVPGRDIEISHHRSHVSCMQKVLIGETDACGTAAPAVRFFQKRMKVQMKTIVRTMDIPHTLFAIHSRVPESERKKIKQRILSWGNTENGHKILNRGSLKPFVSIDDSDYDIVREIAESR